MIKYVFFLIPFCFRLSASAQLVNADFERWDTTYVSAYEDLLSKKFSIKDPVDGEVSSWSSGSQYGASRTTDAFSGKYALVLYTWYTYIPGNITYMNGINYRPEYLKGHYKYIGDVNIGELASGFGSIILKSSQDTVGYAKHYFDTTSVYRPFEIEIEYFDQQIPNEIIVFFESANQTCSREVDSSICNLLYLDNLSLSSGKADRE